MRKNPGHHHPLFSFKVSRVAGVASPRPCEYTSAHDAIGAISTNAVPHFNNNQSRRAKDKRQKSGGFLNLNHRIHSKLFPRRSRIALRLVPAHCCATGRKCHCRGVLNAGFRTLNADPYQATRCEGFERGEDLQRAKFPGFGPKRVNPRVRKAITDGPFRFGKGVELIYRIVEKEQLGRGLGNRSQSDQPFDRLMQYVRTNLTSSFRTGHVADARLGVRHRTE